MPWHNARPRARSPKAPAAFIDPAIPTKVSKPPEGNTWAHEIKHDGYRIQIHVTGNGVRLYTMSGYDWTDRYPLIVKAAGKIKGTAIIDAEAAIVGAEGISDAAEWRTRLRKSSGDSKKPSQVALVRPFKSKSWPRIISA